MCIFSTKFPKDECAFCTNTAIMTDKPRDIFMSLLKMKFACFTFIHSSLPSRIQYHYKSHLKFLQI